MIETEIFVQFSRNNLPLATDNQRFFTARFCPETVNVSPFRRITTVLSVKVGTSSTPVTLIACKWSSSTLCEDFCAVLAACSMAF